MILLCIHVYALAYIFVWEFIFNIAIGIHNITFYSSFLSQFNPFRPDCDYRIEFHYIIQYRQKQKFFIHRVRQYIALSDV